MAKVSIEQPAPKTNVVKMSHLPKGRLAKVVEGLHKDSIVVGTILGPVILFPNTRFDGWSNGCGNEIDIEILPAGFKVTIEQE